MASLCEILDRTPSNLSYLSFAIQRGKNSAIQSLSKSQWFAPYCGVSIGLLDSQEKEVETRELEMSFHGS